MPDSLPEHCRILLAIRRRRGWSQRQLGFALCVSEATIANWERARSAPNARDLPVLRKMLDDDHYQP